MTFKKQDKMRSQNLCHGKEGRGHEKAARYYFSMITSRFGPRSKNLETTKAAFFPDVG